MDCSHKIQASTPSMENQQFFDNSKFFFDEKIHHEQNIKKIQITDSEFPDFFTQLPIQRLGKTSSWKLQDQKMSNLHPDTLQFKGWEEGVEKWDEKINFIVESESQGSEEDYKFGRRRKKDQNLCKKYHSIAQKIIKKLKLNNFLLYIKGIKHRLEYFLILILIVQKVQKINLFAKYYKKAAEKEIKKYEGMKKKIVLKKENEKNDHIIVGFQNSIKSLQVFMGGKIEESLVELFDKTKAKSHVYESESLKRILKLNKQLRSGNKSIEEILAGIPKHKN